MLTFEEFIKKLEIETLEEWDNIDKKDKEVITSYRPFVSYSINIKEDEFSFIRNGVFKEKPINILNCFTDKDYTIRKNSKPLYKDYVYLKNLV